MEVIGKVLSRVDDIFAAEKPDALLILGDTNSALSAIAAKRRKIPVFHMEAGNRCFDDRVPEEINRRIVDHVSDINLTYSKIARENLLREGLSPDRVIVTGSPLKEVLYYYLPEIQASKVLEDLAVERGSYFVVSAHREEVVDCDAMFSKLISILNFLVEEYRLPVLFSTHPRTRKRIEFSTVVPDKKIVFLKPLDFCSYLRLQIDARVVLSDSGTITEESSLLNFPALNLRETHERQEGMEEAAVMMVGMDIKRVKVALAILKDQRRGDARSLNPVSDYDLENVSEKIVRIINSYINYVNRVVWGG
jgi:UDP-N-acetylglucosamine 2-epimerase (non-hydrolysing)